MNSIPPGAHLLGLPTPQPQRTTREVRFRGCNIGFVVSVGPDGLVYGYEMHIEDKQEETVYIFAFDQRVRDNFSDQLVSLPNVGTNLVGQDGSLGGTA